jgi:hypothetical protein
MEKQTTLSLLRKKLVKDQEISPVYNEYINRILYDIDNELLAIEKEQIRDAFNAGMNNSVDYFIPFLQNNDESENYYNQIYKS